MADAPLPLDPIAEARRHWIDGVGRRAHGRGDVADAAQQLVLAAVEDELRPFGLTFSSYEALMLLSFTRRGEMPLGQDERAADGPPGEHHEHGRPAGGAGASSSGGATTATSGAILAAITPAGRQVAAEATEPLNKIQFGWPCSTRPTPADDQRRAAAIGSTATWRRRRRPWTSTDPLADTFDVQLIYRPMSTAREQWQAAFDGVAAARRRRSRRCRASRSSRSTGPTTASSPACTRTPAGPYASMYRSKLWTMRMFAGFGTADDTNWRFKEIIKAGGDGLSTAFDMPTLLGHRLRRPDGARRGRPLRRGHRQPRRHGGPLRRHRPRRRSRRR